MSGRAFARGCQRRARIPSVINFRQRRFFPERRYSRPLRWIMWGAIVVLFLVFLLFMKLFK
jgi:hypothetical protein